MIGIFIHIPKTGGLSIQDALALQQYRNRRKLVKGAEYGALITFGHELLPSLQRHNLAPRDAFTFAFCRNPYDRAVSIWAYYRERYGMPELSFPAFCRDIGKMNWRIRNPQARWLDGVDLGFLGRFEHLQEDFDHLCDALGTERRSLPHLNSSKRRPCSAYYDGETQAIIRAHYARDFERFGYADDHLPDG